MTLKKDNALRSKVYYKTNGHCAYCGEWQDAFSEWHIDHMIPRSRGGTNNIKNLVLSCPQCNGRKHNKTIEEFRRYLSLQVSKKLRDAVQFLTVNPLSDPDETLLIQNGLQNSIEVTETIPAKFFIDSYLSEHGLKEYTDFQKSDQDIRRYILRKVHESGDLLGGNFAYFSEEDFETIDDSLDRVFQPVAAKLWWRESENG